MSCLQELKLVCFSSMQLERVFSLVLVSVCSKGGMGHEENGVACVVEEIGDVRVTENQFRRETESFVVWGVTRRGGCNWQEQS